MATKECKNPNLMSDAAVLSKLSDLPNWSLDTQRGAITREFVLPDFVQAFAFMGHVAGAAETHNHHPEWRNVYNKVTITWTTHDARGLTDKDIRLARLCDELYAVQLDLTPPL